MERDLNMPLDSFMRPVVISNGQVAVVPSCFDSRIVISDFSSTAVEVEMP
jgi:hypothetical protein